MCRGVSEAIRGSELAFARVVFEETQGFYPQMLRPSRIFAIGLMGNGVSREEFARSYT